MKKRLSFSFVLILIISLWSLIIFLSIPKLEYDLKFRNIELYKDKYLLYPNKVNFKPNKISDFEKHYHISIYNFYYHLDQSYFEIEGQTIWLRLV
ncbi:hypothetical protein LD118_00515 [Mesoplasma lactucae ATCC 49193]|nr:hypothetical protein MLACT_v1c03480 [Mesoplasma lactucae ATCC 49193]MCL8216918.1 hypothetical protein [Mesoplasma lactucae ATCC 49193]